MKIHLTSVHVDDPRKAFAFYTEMLGFVEVMYMPDMNLAIVASPEQPDGTALLLEPSDHPLALAYREGIYGLGMPAIVFGTPDIQAEYERLRQKGVVFRQPPTTNEYGTQALFDDTCGNLIQLHQA